jgi:hypothetical protein
MCPPDLRLCPLFTTLLHALLGHVHQHTLHAVADLVWALLLSQSLHPADLARALPELKTPCARQALRRVQRVLGCPLLQSQFLTPLLIDGALRLVPDAEVTLVLDSTRCRHWELFTLGVVFGGRVLPVAWAVLPYPWPKGQFTPTAVGLLERTFRHWPPTRPVHLLADRGFPSLPFCRCLAQGATTRPLGFTMRLRASDFVRLADGRAYKVGDLEQDLAPGQWTIQPASYLKRGHAGPTTWLVIGRGIPSYPAHQQGPADQARRARRTARRQAHVRSKGQPQAVRTDTAWALLSVVPSAAGAVARYAVRFHTEPTYRDLKSWDLAPVADRHTEWDAVDRILGLAVLGYFAQAAIGAAAGRTEEPSVRARQQQWCTTDRLSVFWRGRQVLHDRAHDWRPWLQTLLPALTQTLTAVPTAATGGTAPPIPRFAKEAA